MRPTPRRCSLGITAINNNSDSSATVRNSENPIASPSSDARANTSATPAIGRIPPSWERVHASPKRSPNAASITRITESKSRDDPASIRTCCSTVAIRPLPVRAHRARAHRSGARKATVALPPMQARSLPRATLRALRPSPSRRPKPWRRIRQPAAR